MARPIEHEPYPERTNKITDTVERYIREVNRIPRLTSEEETALARRIRRGDQDALRRLVEGNLGFVVTVALEYQNKGLPLSDLINEGNIGLIHAAEHFDETRGCKFISYAVWWIRQGIRQAFADQVRFIRLPRLQAEAIRKFEEVIRKKEQAIVGPVAPHSITEEQEENRKKTPGYLYALMNTAAQPYSLDEPVENDENNWLTQIEDSTSPVPDEALMENGMQEAVHEAVQALPEREARVICQYFGVYNDMPQSLEEIGRQLGLSRERVRQLKERGLQRLRHSSTSRRLRAFL